MFLFPTIPCFFYVLNDNIRTIWSINDWASTKWACRVGNNDAELWFERKIAEHNHKI